jgi:hypothetical protein
MVALLLLPINSKLEVDEPLFVIPDPMKMLLLPGIPVEYPMNTFEFPDTVVLDPSTTLFDEFDEAFPARYPMNTLLRTFDVDLPALAPTNVLL